jgi:hypothetical protein
VEVIIKGIENRKTESPFWFAMAEFKTDGKIPSIVNFYIYPIIHLLGISGLQTAQAPFCAVAIKQESNKGRDSAVAKVAHHLFLFFRILSFYEKHLVKSPTVIANHPIFFLAPTNFCDYQQGKIFVNKRLLGSIHILGKVRSDKEQGAAPHGNWFFHKEEPPFRQDGRIF